MFRSHDAKKLHSELHSILLAMVVWDCSCFELTILKSQIIKVYPLSRLSAILHRNGPLVPEVSAGTECPTLLYDFVKTPMASTCCLRQSYIRYKSTVTPSIRLRWRLLSQPLLFFLLRLLLLLLLPLLLLGLLHALLHSILPPTLLQPRAIRWL